MGQLDCRGGFVDFLAAGAGAFEVFLEGGGFGEGGARRERGRGFKVVRVCGEGARARARAE